MFALVTLAGGPPALYSLGGIWEGRAVRLALPPEILWPPRQESRRARIRREAETGLLREELDRLGIRTALPERRLRDWTPECLGLRMSDRMALRLALGPRLAVLAAEGRPLDLAAVYTDGRMSRAAAGVIGTLCGFSRSVAVLPEVEGGLVGACYGVADLSRGSAADLHVFLSPPTGEFLPRSGAAVLSLCGDFAALPPGSFVDAALAPPEAYLLRGFSPTGLAAALAECGALRPDQVLIDRLVRKPWP